MYLLLVILMVIASVLMCFIVLIQNSKGGGLASGFSSSNQIMGVRKTTDFLEKATWSLAVFLVVMSVASAYVIPSVSHKGGDVILEQAQQEEKDFRLNSHHIGQEVLCKYQQKTSCYRLYPVSNVAQHMF